MKEYAVTDSESRVENFSYFSLPFELRLQILTYLSLGDLGRYGCVCKKACLDFNSDQVWNNRLVESSRTTELGKAKVIFKQSFFNNQFALLFRKDKTILEAKIAQQIKDRIEKEGTKLTELQKACLQSEPVKELLINGEASIDQIISKSSPFQVRHLDSNEHERIRNGFIHLNYIPDNQERMGLF